MTRKGLAMETARAVVRTGGALTDAAAGIYTAAAEAATGAGWHDAAAIYRRAARRAAGLIDAPTASPPPAADDTIEVGWL